MAESAVGLLQILDRYRIIAGLTLAQSLLTLVLIAGAFVAGGTLQWVVTAYLVGKTVWGISVSAAALSQARSAWGAGWWRTPSSTLSGRWREMARFGLSTNLTGSLTLVTRDSQILWLSAFSSPLQVGYYKVSLAILNFILIPVQPLINTTYREVAQEIGRRQWDNARYLLRSGSLLSAAFTLPAVLGLVVFGRLLISLWGTEFLPTAYASLLILLVGTGVVNVFYWSRNVLLPLGMPGVPTLVYFIGAVLMVIGIVLVVPTAGANGMAFLLSGFFVFTTLTLVWITRQELSKASRSSPISAAG